MQQPTLFDTRIQSRRKTTTTFQDNVSLPTHNWFRYSAGFSGSWARDVLISARDEGRQHILDPFAGSGTSIIEGASLGLHSLGIDAHPFVVRIAKAKLCWFADANEFLRRAMHVIEIASRLKPRCRHPSELIERCYPPHVLGSMNALLEAHSLDNDGSIYSELIWLAIVSILRSVSPVGTASWQYILPKKAKIKSDDPFQAYRGKVSTMHRDIAEMARKNGRTTPNSVEIGDARTLSTIPDQWADFIITSPPYANNYDYADAVRLEMTFVEEVSSWSELHPKVRRNLICSCSQHASADKISLDEALADPALTPISERISAVCRDLRSAKSEHPGNKAYDVMIARYFRDMAKFFHSLRRASAPGVKAVFIIGDSAPYGIHVPVDQWLGELALSAGFETFSFSKSRDRNTKWKNRKHQIPLHEGALTIEG